MYSFDEIGLIAATISEVSSRKNVCTSISEDSNKLPIFISPMTCLVNQKNFEYLNTSRMIPILPVTYDNWEYRKEMVEKGYWVAMTIKEFEKFTQSAILTDSIKYHVYHICIDTAQGHMRKLYELVKEVKSKHRNQFEIMIGNIMNPEAYIYCMDAMVDYVRVSVGTGSGCITSVNTGFHASMPWILSEISKIKSDIKSGNLWVETYYPTKVIADGGIDCSSKLIKSLALGADYVMIGSWFGNTGDACSSVVNPLLSTTERRWYYGQASEQGQLDRFGEVKNKAEGIKKIIDIKYNNINELEKEIDGDLRSAMSYAGALELSNFIGNVKYRVQTINEFKTYNK